MPDLETLYAFVEAMPTYEAGFSATKEELSTFITLRELSMRGVKLPKDDCINDGFWVDEKTQSLHNLGFALQAYLDHAHSKTRQSLRLSEMQCRALLQIKDVHAPPKPSSPERPLFTLDAIRPLTDKQRCDSICILFCLGAGLLTGTMATVAPEKHFVKYLRLLKGTFHLHGDLYFTYLNG